MTFDQAKRSVQIIPIILAVFVLCIMVSPAWAMFGGKVDSFSADNVEIAPNGKVVNTSKIYMTPDAMRMDGMPGGGGKGMPKMDISLLVLKKQDKQYFYNHDKKLVFESPVDEEMTKAGYKVTDNIDSEKVIGKEEVSGYKCVKKEVVISIKALGQTMKNKLIVWESDKFEMPLRTMDEDGAVQEMRNIKTGKPSKKLFQPLTGYKKVGNMMAVMGLDFGAMMGQDKAAQEADMAEEKTTDGQESETVDTQSIMAHLQESMGDNMSPEEKAQMMQMMAQAMGQANQTNMGQGASKDLWEIIPKRGGDTVGYEMKMHNTLDVILGTNSTLQQVFDFYGKKLSAKGWKNQSTYIEEGQGMMSMRKGGDTIMFAWADKPMDMRGNYKLYYNVHYIGAY